MLLQFGNKYASDTDMVKEARPGVYAKMSLFERHGRSSADKRWTVRPLRRGQGTRQTPWERMFHSTVSSSDLQVSHDVKTGLLQALETTRMGTR